MSQARLRDDEEEEVAPQQPTAGKSTVTKLGARQGGGGTVTAVSGGNGAAAGRGGGIADGFTVTDAPQEMDVNLEYKELAREEDGDDEDPDVMLGTQPGGTLKNVSFRVRNRWDGGWGRGGREESGEGGVEGGGAGEIWPKHRPFPPLNVIFCKNGVSPFLMQRFRLVMLPLRGSGVYDTINEVRHVVLSGLFTILARIQLPKNACLFVRARS